MQKVRFSRHQGFARLPADKEQPMKVRQLRDLTDAELQSRLAETRQELFNLRFQSATGALENSARLRLAKREIARILTIRHEREDALERNH